jgi:hypothetical protein
MRVKDFSVTIPQGVETREGYVEMEHDRQYTIGLRNASSRQCDAEVKVDGKLVGTFRLRGYGSTTLERSPEDSGRFTFLRLDSAEAGAAGLGNVARDDLGTIQVTFRPERPSYGEEKTSGMFPTVERSKSLRTRGPGGTGLTGHSSQSFVTVGGIDHDPAETVIVTLRLVERERGVRPLVGARPVEANPVPPPVG